MERGFSVRLDGKQARTPKRHLLLLPNLTLAEAVAAEFEAQKEHIIPDSMPLTQIAVITLDVVAEAREALVEDIGAYAETDLLCYRAEEKETAAVQEREWRLPLQWAMQRYDVHFEVTQAIIPVAQPKQTVMRLRQAITTLGDWELAACAVLVRATGSLVLSLALLEEAFPASEIARFSRLDEDLQTERWGEDAEKQERLARMEAEIRAAEKFLHLLQA